jgi:hypothetical protein
VAGFFSSLAVWTAFMAAFITAAHVLFRRLTRMARRRPADTGPVLRVSRWGDAEVNGVGCDSSVRVVECEKGWLIESHWLMGGGMLWLPRTATRVGELTETGQARGTRRVLEAGPHRVELETELAEFVA